MLTGAAALFVGGVQQYTSDSSFMLTGEILLVGGLLLFANGYGLLLRKSWVSTLWALTLAYFAVLAAATLVIRP